MSTRLTRNFSLEEMIEAGSARRLGQDEQFNPSETIKTNLFNLCMYLLQPLRDHFNHAIHIVSGYRSEEVNSAVGGAKKSDHLTGKAADIQLWINGKNCNQRLFDAVVELRLPFKQMIDEFGTETEPAWIHLSFDEKNNKREVLRARKVKGKTVYTKIKI